MRGQKEERLKGINAYNFKQLATTKGSSRERRRYLAFAHIQEGKSFTKAAKAVMVSYRSLMNWVNNFKEHGIKGLEDKGGRGVKPMLSYEEEAAFKQAVLELQDNRKGGRVRGKDIMELMKKKYGIDPCLNTVYNTLKRVGLVWITGRSVHPKVDVEAQESFKKTSKKK